MTRHSLGYGRSRLWRCDKFHAKQRLERFSAAIPDYSGIAAVLPDSASYYAFADHSIWVNVFAMKLSDKLDNPAPVIGICGAYWFPVAGSFEEFVGLYANDPMSNL